MTKCMPEQPMVEQPSEEVQLTELRPVEHSRIKVVGGNGDYEAADTDGLRALRSFSSKQQLDELQHFGARYPRKRKHDRWQHLEMGLRDEALEEHEKAVKRMTGIIEMSDSMDIEENEAEDTYGENGVNGDFEYLEERNEIYDYLDQHEDCSSPEIEGAAVESVKSLQKAAKNANIKKGKPGRPRGRPRKKKTIVKIAKIAKKSVQPVFKINKSKAASAESIETEAELRSKINDIIQANYRLQRENNNVLENAIDKLQVSGSPQEKTAEEKKKHRCGLCGALFKGSGGLRNHYKVMHTDGPGYECNECGKEFPLKERLKLHMRTHTGFKPYKCKTCDKSFARGGQLVQHERTHSKVKPYACHLCSGRFTCAANLALHVKRHNGQKDHKCELCSRAFVRRDALKKHHECLHQDLKSFVCKICKKTFKGHLPQHMRTHAQDRPHGCATCGQQFAQKSQLTVHQRTHSGQRPFRCLVCWQAFAHSTALKLHTRRHTGERPFKCPECTAGFTQLPHWKKHMKCIHGRSEPYGCSWCQCYFRIKNDLEAHQKICDKQPADWDSGCSSDGLSSTAMAKFRNMSIERMRLLLAVLLQRISKPQRLIDLGFGKRLIDELLVDSLLAAGKQALRTSEEVSEFESLQKNLELFLEWTVPGEYWQLFQKFNKSAEDILDMLTCDPEQEEIMEQCNFGE